MNRKILISLGGNALGTQTRTLRDMSAQLAVAVADLTEDGYQPLLCHGNGPQVGALQNAFGTEKHINRLEAIELADSVAMTQSYMGYQLQNALESEFRKRKLDTQVATVVTRVLVDPEDPAFLRPTKPVGPFYTEQEAKELEANGKTMREDAGRGYREVVASPEPLALLEADVIRLLSEDGVIVIAGGGGGIPVTQTNDGIAPVNAVIDKDFVSAHMADAAGCAMLVILTGVDYVYSGFLQGNPKKLETLTADEARRLGADGEFAEGSMLPKMKAAVRFAETGSDRKTLITSVEKLREGLRGEVGTWIVPDEK